MNPTPGTMSRCGSNRNGNINNNILNHNKDPYASSKRGTMDPLTGTMIRYGTNNNSKNNITYNTNNNIYNPHNSNNYHRKGKMYSHMGSFKRETEKNKRNE